MVVHRVRMATAVAVATVQEIWAQRMPTMAQMEWIKREQRKRIQVICCRQTKDGIHIETVVSNQQRISSTLPFYQRV